MHSSTGVAAETHPRRKLRRHVLTSREAAGGCRCELREAAGRCSRNTAALCGRPRGLRAAGCAGTAQGASRGGQAALPGRAGEARVPRGAGVHARSWRGLRRRRRRAVRADHRRCRGLLQDGAEVAHAGGVRRAGKGDEARASSTEDASADPAGSWRCWFARRAQRSAGRVRIPPHRKSSHEAPVKPSDILSKARGPRVTLARPSPAVVAPDDQGEGRVALIAHSCGAVADPEGFLLIPPRPSRHKRDDALKHGGRLAFSPWSHDGPTHSQRGTAKGATGIPAKT